MPITTSGFTPRSGVLPTFTPVDPRLAVADPAALMNGITSGMAFQRGIIADQNFRQISPLQQQLAMAQAQQDIAELPMKEKRRQMEFDAAQRADSLARLQPPQINAGNYEGIDPVTGDRVEYQNIISFDENGNPQYPAQSPIRTIETVAQKDQKERAAQALADKTAAQTGNFQAQAEKNRAQTKQIEEGKTPDSGYKPGEIRDLPPFGGKVIWSSDPAKITDLKTGEFIYIARLDYTGKVVGYDKNTAIWPKEVITDPGAGGTLGVDAKGNLIVGGNAASTGIQTQGAVPAAMQDVEARIPVASFDDPEQAQVAAQTELIKEGQWILINGVLKQVIKE